jgi:lipoate-protein ligase A
VLHEDELTYSVVAHSDDGVPRGVAASYRHLSAALAEAYRTLGVEAELTHRARGAAGSGACYLHATQADLSIGAAKLSGSAQVWSGDAVLQHGSLVRTRDDAVESEVFRLGEQGRRSLASSTATLAGVTGESPPFEAIADAVTDAFERILGVRLELGEISRAERHAGEGLESDHVVRTAPRNL